MTLNTYATVTPSPINVNIFGLRFTTDCQARSKNGQPPQSTTGVASASSIQIRTLIGNNRAKPGINSLIPMTNTGTVNRVLTQNLRRISTSSGFSSSDKETVRGSKAIPQIGQLPGASRMISGCMGQVYSIFCLGGTTDSGSSSMPHLGHAPGLGCRTSGCIGHV